ncbi:hypothetical protein RND71_015995 [Anisodus tanguticus]|uniref:Uncharacterized protein n=1 Tax=Anisodus tanguticus TaxID=243964 RepID=A0AAE1S847_9SOLA|nr:hypothetical protein RND71_015995 [Anisodus tanguticus]
MQESLKLLQAQVLSHIAYGRFGVPRSPPPHPDDDDDIEPEYNGEYSYSLFINIIELVKEFFELDTTHLSSKPIETNF